MKTISMLSDRINIFYILPSSNQYVGGVRQYSNALLNILPRIEQIKVYVYGSDIDKEIIELVARNQNLVLVSGSKSKEYFIEKIFRKYLETISLLLGTKLASKPFYSHIDRLCKKYDIDIIHSPHQVLPPHSKKYKSIFTLHDVQEIHFPEYFTPEARALRANSNLTNLNLSDAVVVSFNHVKGDLIKYFRVLDEKVFVILLEMSDLWFKNFNKSNRPVSTITNGIDRYLLYPANTWQHKNHIRLLQSIARLRDEYGLNVCVICTGHKNDHFEEIKLVMDDLGLHDQVKFLGIVDEQDLYDLYQSSIGVVIPTTYEAGSFPLYESILMSVPVICSNVTSLPETIGSEEYIFDPFDIVDMSERIRQFWISQDFRDSSVAQGQKMKHTFTDNDEAKKILNMYKSVLDQA